MRPSGGVLRKGAALWRRRAGRWGSPGPGTTAGAPASWALGRRRTGGSPAWWSRSTPRARTRANAASGTTWHGTTGRPSTTSGRCAFAAAWASAPQSSTPPRAAPRGAAHPSTQRRTCWTGTSTRTGPTRNGSPTSRSSATMRAPLCGSST